jgi:hypothetical protein
MKSIALLAGVLSCITSFCQSYEPITITTQSITIPGGLAVANWKNDHPNEPFKYPKLVYGFAAGDEIIIDFATDNKKGTQQIEVMEYGNKSIVYSNKQFQTLDGIRIRVPRSNVYKFEFATNHLFDRSCKVCIRRIPVADSTKNFNCAVTWKTIYDTTFTVVEEKRKISSKYEPVTLQTPIDFFVNSGSNAAFKGGKSRIALPIMLPANTVSWYYSFAATRNNNTVQATKSTMKLFSELTRLIDQTGTLSFGVNVLTQPPGANYCDIYLLDETNRAPFLNKDEGKWRIFSEGSRENLMSGIVQVRNCCTGNNFYLGIKNPDSGYGIAVMIEIVAIVEKAVFETVQVKKPASVSKKVVPVFGT